MSDESVYYSPGEVDSTGQEDEDTEIVIRKNLMAEYEEEPVKTKTERNREPMKVYLRIRPFTPEEIKAKENQSCLEYLDGKSILLRAPQDSFTFKSSIRGIAEQTHQFSFSKVYNDSICQKSFFDDAILGCVKDFIEGINCLVFTYGVTNSGKTYTIQGHPRNGGILPRTLDVLFNSIKGKQHEQINLKPTMYQDVTKLTKEQQKYEEVLKSAILNAGQKENVDLSILWKMDTTNNSDMSTMSSASSNSTYTTANEPDYSSIAEELKERVCDGTVVDVKSQGPVNFCIWVSFAEIYNEYVYDLLDPTPTGKGKKRNVLKLAGDKKGNPYIKGLKEVQVNSADEAFKVLRFGQKNQNIAVTKLNQNSSRSHSIFTIKILRIVDVDDPHVVRISRLSFVDLAGSERHCKTQSTGDRLKEASNINTSIMTLGKCIEYLRYNQQHKNHPLIIPFRENKLTRLFQGFFLGKGKACMIVNVSPCASVFDETFNVLKFSAVAKEVTTKPSRNTEIFKPKQIPKPVLTAATPVSNADRSHWLHAGMTTPRPIQKDILVESCFNEKDRIQAMVNSYEEIRKQLIEERRKNAIMELKIREEVCSEMSEQIVEIEKNYSERLQEEQQCLEEQCEKRIELLTKSMKKSRKRKKIDRIETDDDSYVSSVLLHAEKVKVKERDETIIAMRAKLAEKEISHEFYKQTHTPEQHPKVITSLQNELEEAKETLKVQGEHIEELQTTLNFAQDTVEERQTEIEKLKEIIDCSEESAANNEILQMKDLLEKTSRALNEARIKLDARDDKIKQRDERIRLLEERLASEKAPSSTDIEQFEKDLARFEEQTKISHQRSEFQAAEIKQLRLEKNEITTEKNAVSDQMEELKRLLEESEERREQLQFRDEEMKGKMRRYDNVIQNHETALAESENLIEQLNVNINKLTDEISDLKTRGLTPEDKCGNNSDANDAGFDEIKEDSKWKDEQMKEKSRMLEELQVKLNEYKRRTEQLENENEQVKEMQESLDSYGKRIEKYEEMLDQKDEHYKTALQKLEEELEKLRKEKKNIEILENKLTYSQRRIDEYRDELLAKEQEFERESISLKANAQKFENDAAILKAEAHKFEMEVASLKSEVQAYGKEVDELRPLKAKLASAQALVEEYKSKLELREKEQKQESKEMKSKTLKNGKAELIRASITNARSPLKTNSAVIKELERTLAETSKALDKKNEQVMMKNNKIEQLLENIGSMKAELDSIAGEKRELETKCEGYLKENENISEGFKELKLKSGSQEEELTKKEGLIVKMREESSNVEMELQAKCQEIEIQFKDRVQSLETEKVAANLKNKADMDEKVNEISSLQKQISSFKENALSYDEVVNKLNLKSTEIEDLKIKLAAFDQKIVSVNSINAKLQETLKSAEEKLENTESELREDIVSLKTEIAKFKSVNQSLEEDLEGKNNDLRSKITELNAIMQEKVTIEGELFKKSDMVASLELQIELRKAEKELSSMQTKEQVHNALLEASKKDSVLVKELERALDERNAVIEEQRKLIEEQKIEIDELTKQTEERKAAAKDLVKDKQLIHKLRCASIESENQLYSVKKEHEDSIRELKQVKESCDEFQVELEVHKRTIKEREEQITNARQEVECLQEEIQKLQTERDEAMRNSQHSSKEESEDQPLLCSVEKDTQNRRSSDIPLGKLKNIILSASKNKFDNDNEEDTFSSAKTRRTSRRAPSSSHKKENASKVESDTPTEGCNSSSKKPKRKTPGRKVLFDINEKPLEDVVFIADTPEIAKEEDVKPKRRRKLLSKNTGMVGDSPQVIPPSPKKTDPAKAIVRRQLRSSTRR